MNSYNGFTARQRYAALYWLKDMQKKGLRDTTPTECEVCGQTEGQLMYHSEDYSSPFGDHIGAYSLCYICHMMIHCRFKGRDAWDMYIEALKNKVQFEPFYFNDWNTFRKDCLIDKFRYRKFKHVDSNNYQVLLDIEAGSIKRSTLA